MDYLLLTYPFPIIANPDHARTRNLANNSAPEAREASNTVIADASRADKCNAARCAMQIRSIAVRYPRREPSGKKPRGARQPLRLGGTGTDWKQGDFYGSRSSPAAINPLSRLFIERERERERIPHLP